MKNKLVKTIYSEASRHLACKEISAEMLRDGGLEVKTDMDFQDFYTHIAALYFNVPCNEVNFEQRERVKRKVLQGCYGMRRPSELEIFLKAKSCLISDEYIEGEISENNSLLMVDSPLDLPLVSRM